MLLISIDRSMLRGANASAARPPHLIRCGISVALMMVVTSAAHAEKKVGSRPGPGVEQTVTVGSPVFEKFRYETKEAAIPEAELTRTGQIRIPAGLPLSQVYSRARFKACYKSATGTGPCALDDDGDGVFDRFAVDEVSAASKLRTPVRYQVEEIAVPVEGDFRQIIVFLGATPDTLRLSYREFSNDLARPAFTEELTFPLAKSFPQTIALKDARLTVLGIDGLGLRYRVEP